MDRTNIGFAIPLMGKELNFSPATLGFASGVLFLGYGVTQTAGGWLADRGHGKGLIAWLMVLWGIAEILQAFITTDTELVLVRFALGFLEGGVLADHAVVRAQLVRAVRTRARQWRLAARPIPWRRC